MTEHQDLQSSVCRAEVVEFLELMLDCGVVIELGLSGAAGGTLLVCLERRLTAR